MGWHVGPYTRTFVSKVLRKRRHTCSITRSGWENACYGSASLILRRSRQSFDWRTPAPGPVLLEPLPLLQQSSSRILSECYYIMQQQYLTMPYRFYNLAGRADVHFVQAALYAKVHSAHCAQLKLYRHEALEQSSSWGLDLHLRACYCVSWEKADHVLHSRTSAVVRYQFLASTRRRRSAIRPDHLSCKPRVQNFHHIERACLPRRQLWLYLRSPMSPRRRPRAR